MKSKGSLEISKYIGPTKIEPRGYEQLKQIGNNQWDRNSNKEFPNKEKTKWIYCWILSLLKKNLHQCSTNRKGHDKKIKPLSN
jgi:hypothetical protein